MKAECTKEKCTLEDFKFELKDLGHGLYVVEGSYEYEKELRKGEHYFCRPVKQRKRKLDIGVSS